MALALPAIAGALLLLAQPARAQQDPPKPDLERAQKAADAVFHWIKLNADKGANRKPPAPAAAPAPAPAPKKAAAPVAAAPRPAPASEPSAPPVAATVAAAPAPVTLAAQPAPEPELDRTPVVLAAAAPTPAPAAPMAAAAQVAQPPAQPEPQAPEEREEPLKLVSKVDPTLPRQLQQGTFRNGFAQVQFTVGTDGSVQQASVIKATHSRLGNAAVDAVRQWRFAPLRKSREAAVEVAFKNDTE
ncbi:hypothetical protein ASD88_01960 [Pelomonas sp. Root662]|nr:hypothetical protein ASC81_01960 [Pelomonas sp. Root405]KRA77666.1 hypothetical protein ASD88_01960 [Pelomonas sp. Root662]